MSAGLPGLGLGGLFFIVSALLAPLPELYRTARGRSSPGAWRQVGRQFGIALAMIVAIDLALRLCFLAVEATGIGDAPAAGELIVLPLVPIGVTLGLLAMLLLTAKAAELALRARRGLSGLASAIPPLPSRTRVVAGGGAIASVWFALLLFGASELSPISGGAMPRQADRGSGAEVTEAPLEVRPSAIGPELGSASGSDPLVTSAASPVTPQTETAPAPGAGDRGADLNSAEEPGGASAGAGSTGFPPDAGESEPSAPVAAAPGLEPEPEGPATSPAEPGAPSVGQAPPTRGPPEDAGPPPGSNAPPDAGPPADGGPPAGGNARPAPAPGQPG